MIKWLLSGFLLIITTNLACFEKNLSSKNEMKATNKPLLTQIIGGLPKANNKTKTCSIDRNHEHVKARLGEIDRWIQELQELPIQTAMHIMAQTPSVEQYVFDQTGKQHILMKDWETMQYRKGPTVDQLKKLFKTLCRR